MITKVLIEVMIKPEKLILIMLIFMLAGCGYCNYSHSVNQVETLSEDQLSKIFYSLKEIYNSTERGIYLNKEQIKEPELKGLEYKFIEIEPDRIDMLLGGCVDDKAYLHVSGFKNESKRSIRLSLGEHSTYREVALWPE